MKSESCYSSFTFHCDINVIYSNFKATVLAPILAHNNIDIQRSPVLFDSVNQISKAVKSGFFTGSWWGLIFSNGKKGFCFPSVTILSRINFRLLLLVTSEECRSEKSTVNSCLSVALFNLGDLRSDKFDFSSTMIV